MPIYNGTQKIDVSGVDKVYVGTQLVYQKSSPAILDYITLSDYTTSLNRGSSFSFGGVVTAHYTNGTTADVTSSTTFSGYNMNTAGTYTVTASYTEDAITKTATYTLTVNKAWSTIWSGNVSATNTNKDVATLSSLSGTVTLRVTWSCSGSGGSGMTNSYYNNNGTTTTTTKPSSPFQFNLATGSARNHIVGIRRINSSNAGKNIYLTWSQSSKKFAITSGTFTTPASATVTLTITKIEQYY